MLHYRSSHRVSATLTEGTSDPPRGARFFVLRPQLACSWLGSCFDGFFVETSFQIRDGVTNAFGRRAAGNFFRCKRGRNAEATREISVKCRRDFLECFE